MILVTAVAAILAFRMGYNVVNITETNVINHYAARYVAEGPKGAKVTDCAAQPGDAEGVWLVIQCGGAAHVVRYAVDRYGKLVLGNPGPEPQT